MDFKTIDSNKGLKGPIDSKKKKKKKKIVIKEVIFIVFYLYFDLLKKLTF
jgi:hypothetical protein